VKRYLLLMRRLDLWMSQEGLAVGQLSGATALAFLDVLGSTNPKRVPTLASLAPMFEFLRVQGAMAAEPPRALTPMDNLLASYRHHLIQDRGLALTTAGRYLTFARRFLAERASRPGYATGAEDLTNAEEYAYMLRSLARLKVESAKREAADLRALLRFLYLAGVIDTDLGAAMPPVATWRGRSLPTTLTQADVTALISACQGSTTSRRRDRAVLVLLARLGLRAGEVAALELGDINWRAGEILVRGKARRRDRLPLPAEVGEALSDYICNARPLCASRRVVLTLYAPFVPIRPCSITDIVQRACKRAGLAEVGAHRLRHTLATEMLRQGADLAEIAQILRHSDLATTAGYAKVDRVSLRSVARPWPGARPW
jgi:site-specific recombinase XerD